MTKTVHVIFVDDHNQNVDVDFSTGWLKVESFSAFVIFQRQLELSRFRVCSTQKLT